MNNFFKKKYRIVTDSFLGYEAQIKRWWFPFWIQKDFTNTFPSIDSARKYAKQGNIIEIGCIND